MPKDFFVYLTNKTGKQIDSIYSEYNAISNIETISKDLRKITLDYKLFSNDPVLIIQTDKKINARIDWVDFADWNNNQTFIFLKENRISAVDK